MAALDFCKVTKDVENIPFDCGDTFINEYVRESYYPLIIQHAYTYSITAKGIVLGFYQILFREIKLEDFPDDVSEYDSELKDGKISSIHIRFLAIDKHYQRRKIGDSVIRIILNDILDMAERWPIRVVTIDAKLHLVDWYKNLGFIEMKNNTDGQDGVTLAMFFDCMKHGKDLEEYIDSID